MVRKLLSYFYRYIGIVLKQLFGRDVYMFFLIRSFKYKGIKFTGKPRFIHQSAYLDSVGDLILGERIVISAKVIILTHDYSYTTGLISIKKDPITDIATLAPVNISDNCFIGAGAVILPGTDIGSNVIIAAGSVVKGKVRGNSIMAGNPAVKICNTDAWALFQFNNISSKKVVTDKR